MRFKLRVLERLATDLADGQGQIRQEPRVVGEAALIAGECVGEGNAMSDAGVAHSLIVSATWTT